MESSSESYTPINSIKDPLSSYKTTATLYERLSRLLKHWITNVAVSNSNQNSENLQDILPISQLLENADNMPQDAENDSFLEDEI